jgi:hypothetical protein
MNRTCMHGASCSANHAAPEAAPGLTRDIGLWQAAALNVTLMVGAGVDYGELAFFSLPEQSRCAPPTRTSSSG